MKFCPKCKNNKSEEEFSKNSSWCKVCVRERSRKYYQDNKEKLLIEHKEYRDERRIWFNEIKSNLKCSRCPEDHIACLEFHHTDPSKKSFGIAESIGQGGISKEQILEEMKKCIVLCSNCHKKEHYNN